MQWFFVVYVGCNLIAGALLGGMRLPALHLETGPLSPVGGHVLGARQIDRAKTHHAPNGQTRTEGSAVHPG